MNIADRLVAVAENQQRVYDAGKKKQYDEFWDFFQDYGNRNHYVYAFAYPYWADKVYNPKYTINAYTYGLQNTFNNSAITDTKVDIIVNGQLAGSFANSKIRTIRKLILNNVTTVTNPFGGCTSLRDITIEGEWLISVNFGVCPLSAASIVSVIEALSVSVTVQQTLTLKKSAVESMVFPHTSAQSGITYNSWDELIAPKTADNKWKINTL